MGIADLVFPKKCLQCGRGGGYVCANCIAKVGKFQQICVECQKRSIDGVTHVRCRRPHGLDGVVSVWEYKGVLRKSVKALKYKFASDVSGELARYTVKFLKSEVTALAEELILVPIPLYARRGNWRGFNQAEEVGRKIAVGMRWKLSEDVLVRKSAREPQTQLKKEDRQKNIRGVFALGEKFQRAKKLGLPFLVFDDVATTGATLREAAKVLKRNGAEKVWGLTIAR